MIIDNETEETNEMTKTTKPTYVCHVRFMAGGSYGSSSESPEAAAKRALAEVREFARGLGGFKDDAQIKLPVFKIPAGKYWRGDETGDYIVDYDTDTDEAFAPIVQVYEGNPRSPISKFQLLDVRPFKKRIREANLKRFS